MRLIKISQDHYVIVDENAEIKEGDLCYDPEGIPGYNNVKCVVKCLRTAPDSYWNKHSKKITHSTEPLELLSENGLSGMGFSKIRPLNVFEIEELIGEVDKFELFLDREVELRLSPKDIIERIKWYYQTYFKEDNKEKKWTDEDVIYFVNKSRETGLTAEYLMLTKQPKTEWEVEMIDGQLKLKQ